MNTTDNRGWKNRTRFHLLFFRSTLGISIPVAIAAIAMLMVSSSAVKNVGGIISAFLACIPLGFLFDLLYKEMSRKGEYYFYYNRGIGRWELWIVSLFLSFSFFVGYRLIIGLWMLV